LFFVDGLFVGRLGIRRAICEPMQPAERVILGANQNESQLPDAARTLS
jgi:hypothetical protein